MMENYIELQKLRLELGTDVQFNISGDVASQKIAPLLFFPLVENAFKHGAKGDSKNAYVHIDLTIDKSLQFSIKNNKGQVDDMEDGRYGGIGLENVKRRLALIYPNKYELDILDGETEFEVKLTLK